MGLPDKVAYTVPLDQPKIDFLEEMTRKYGLADTGKAVRILIDHARENPAMQDAIFGEVHCIDCG